MGTDEQARAVGELFNIIGHIYGVRTGRRTYIRLSANTPEPDEQQLLLRELGGKMMFHIHSKHVWELSQYYAVIAALNKLQPYLTGIKLQAAETALLMEYAHRPAERWAIAEHVRQLVRYGATR